MTEVDLDITIGKESIEQPWLSYLARDFQIQFIVMKANINGEHGRVYLRLQGSVEEIQRATTWLMTTGMQVEALQRSLGV